MTNAIETLVLNLEAAANESKPVYRTLQNLLKEIRDNHHIKLEVALNKDIQQLKAEAKRVASAFRSGTVEEATAKTTAKKAQPKVTHTIDEEQAPVKESQPKQASVEIQLANALAEIQELRQQLADKTNEVAEYAEALAHAQTTISQQAKALATKAQEQPTQPEQEVADEIDILTEAINDGYLPELLTNVYIKVKKAYGTYKANAINTEINTIAFVTKEQMASDIRQAFSDTGVDVTVLDDAIAVTKEYQVREMYDNDAWVLANRKGYTVTLEHNGYAVRTKEGLIVTNKIPTVEKLLQYVRKL